MRAITVCVDYHDYLSRTLPLMRHHFSDVWIITSEKDIATHSIIEMNGANCFISNSFYKNGALFNKYLPIEECLDFIGREGWICLLDADILWPREINWTPSQVGCLYTPLRRDYERFMGDIPREEDWDNFPRHRNISEWAGWTQIFHASDSALGSPPWHEINWKHAGGGDSMFQAKWPSMSKLRPPFECLALGPHGKNWAGRATDYVYGGTPLKAEERSARLAKLLSLRGRKNDPDPFRHEKF